MSTRTTPANRAHATPSNAYAIATAVKHDKALRLVVLPIYFGLAIVAEEDYPAEEDVRKDVDYKNGIYTGTLELPTPGDVRDGTDYAKPAM